MCVGILFAGKLLLGKQTARKRYKRPIQPDLAQSLNVWIKQSYTNFTRTLVTISQKPRQNKFSFVVLSHSIATMSVGFQMVTIFPAPLVGLIISATHDQPREEEWQEISWFIQILITPILQFL